MPRRSKPGRTGSRSDPGALRRRSGAPVCAALLAALLASGPARAAGDGVARLDDLAYATRSTQHRLDLYLPPGRGPFPLVVMVHGGGWAGDDKRSGGPLQEAEMKHFPDRGYAVASVNYRLSGEAFFPAAIHDVKAAVRWLRAHAGQYRLDPGRIALWGASAGGHLAALAALSRREPDLEDLGMGSAAASSEVAALVTVNGPSDLLRLDAQALGAGCGLFRGGYDAPGSYTSRLMGCDITAPACRAKALAANPVRHATRDDPPVLIVQGTRDCAVAPGQARLLEEVLRRAGVDVTLHWVEGAEHGSPLYTEPAALGAVDRFLDRTIGPDRPAR